MLLAFSECGPRPPQGRAPVSVWIPVGNSTLKCQESVATAVGKVWGNHEGAPLAARASPGLKRQEEVTGTGRRDTEWKGLPGVVPP